MSFLAAGIGAAIGLTTGTNSYYKAESRRKRANRSKKKYQEQLDSLIENRQDVINPYADALNTFNNLQVATGAAEMEADESDVSLANTLDALTAFGYGGGGATTIAQEAARAKRGISASIEKQETRIQELSAEAEERAQNKIMEGNRYAWEARERREQSYINRAASLLDQERSNELGYEQQATDMLSSFGSTAMNFGLGAFTGASGN